MRYLIEFWSPKPDWYKLSRRAREQMVKEWNALLRSPPEARQAKLSLHLCQMQKGQLDLLICQIRVGFDQDKIIAGKPSLNWSYYFTKVAFVENDVSAEEYAHKLNSISVAEG